MEEADRPFVSNVAVPAPEASLARPRRRRKATSKLLEEEEELPTPKLKFKINGGANSRNDSGPRDGRGVGWDRELDSDPEEPLAVEEQFILRLTPDAAPKLREMVQSRNVTSDVWFKFKDSRRAVFHLGDKLYGAKLVDLPTLLESQRMTGTGGHCVKVCDISQMLLVEEEIQDEADVTRDKAFNIEDFVYPHGLTPPLRHVRKRRFRKRINKRTIETVENAVEKLLEQDAKADEVEYEFLDHDPTSDDEYGSESRPRQDENDVDSLGAPTPSGQVDGEDDGRDGEDDVDFEGGEEDQDDEDDEDEAFDSDLANEINKGLEALNASASEDGDDDASGGSGNDGLFGASSDDDDDDEEEEEENGTAGSPEALEQRRRIKLLAEETNDLEKAIAAKESDMQKAANPIFKKRFEEIIKKLTAERDLKKAQHTAAVRDMEKKKAGLEHTTTSAEAASASSVQPSLPVAVSDPKSAPTGQGEDELSEQIDIPSPSSLNQMDES